MMTVPDLVTLYDTKALEYLIAVAYLLLFVPFWRALQGAPRPHAVRVPHAAATSWFALPDGVRLHPGHAWARVEADGLVAVGLDDFAHKLVGPLETVALPARGSVLAQGRPAFRVAADRHEVDVLAPVDGTVVAVNDDAVTAPGALAADPYGAGWLFKLKADGGLAADLKQLLAGDGARLWMERSAEGLRQRLSPELGALAADGGQPIHGFARELDPAHWDRVVREFLLTDDLPEEGGSHA